MQILPALQSKQLMWILVRELMILKQKLVRIKMSQVSYGVKYLLQRPVRDAVRFFVEKEVYQIILK